MPRSLPTIYVARGRADHTPFNVVAFGGPWVYVQVFTHGYDIVANGSYSLRGLTSGHSVSGTTDELGLVYEDRLPSDEYELTVQGATERVPLYTDEMRQEVIQPWALRMRAISAREGAEGGDDPPEGGEDDGDAR